MFIFSFKFNYKKAILFLSIIVLVLFLGISLMEDTREVNIFNVSDKSNLYNFTNIKTNKDRVNFLKQFGWDVEEQPIEIMEVQIPQEFDEVYKNYNEIQKEVGLDLEKYKGKRVKRYTYRVLNHPSGKDVEVRANILIYKNRVIAGDIMTTAIDGFMNSLLYKI
ncbi:MAG: DUF4830 domain-containing protein [Clostridiaceae bacterium]|nr:DUF4830 domain-containing protein [Clostridiaceae bacterium]